MIKIIKLKNNVRNWFFKNQLKVKLEERENIYVIKYYRVEFTVRPISR